MISAFAFAALLLVPLMRLEFGKVFISISFPSNSVTGLEQLVTLFLNLIQCTLGTYGFKQSGFKSKKQG